MGVSRVLEVSNKGVSRVIESSQKGVKWRYTGTGVTTVLQKSYKNVTRV